MAFTRCAGGWTRCAGGWTKCAEAVSGCGCDDWPPYIDITFSGLTNCPGFTSKPDGTYRLPFSQCINNSHVIYYQYFGDPLNTEIQVDYAYISGRSYLVLGGDYFSTMDWVFSGGLCACSVCVYDIASITNRADCDDSYKAYGGTASIAVP